MGQDVFQVLRAVFGGFDRIVAEVFLDGARIVTLDHLLAAVAEPGIAGLLVDPLLKGLGLFFGILGIDGLVGVLNEEIVVDTQIGRRQFYTLVPGLCDVVETGIVHDGGCCAVLLCEGCAAERVDGVCR